jgi:hypothetical protein
VGRGAEWAASEGRGGGARRAADLTSGVHRVAWPQLLPPAPRESRVFFFGGPGLRRVPPARSGAAAAVGRPGHRGDPTRRPPRRLPVRLGIATCTAARQVGMRSKLRRPGWWAARAPAMPGAKA